MLLSQQIATNRRNTYLLVALISLLLLALGAALGLFWNSPGSGIGIAILAAFFLGTFSYYQGDQLILRYSHARQIAKHDNPQLFNVVEEMAIAAGLPLPQIYLIEDEAPNAFATGRDPEHASLAITTGLLKKLNRDQLQGVMAHELSHVQDRDILYTMMVGVLAGSIVLLSDYVTRYLFWTGGGSLRRRGNRERSQANALLMALGLVLIILAPLIARLVQLAVSRQREYLADASAAKLTRYPEGLASALELIANDSHELRVANRATAHLYVVNPFRNRKLAERNSVFDTHPPLKERIRRLRELR